MAVGELDDCLIRLGELFVPVDFVVLDMDQDDEEEPYLQLGRSFMETTKMEINMRDGILKMTVLRKTLKVDLTDEDAPIHYKARPFPYDFDETKIDRALNGIKGIKRQAQHLGVQNGGRVRGKARKPWRIGISGHLHKDPHDDDNKGDFSLKNFQPCISNYDAAKRKREGMEDALNDGDEKKQKNSFRELEDEGKKENPNGSTPNVAGPKEDEVDQPFKSTP